MKSPICFAVLALTPTIASAAPGPILWQTLRYDMSHNEVAARQPSATKPTDDRHLHSGETCDLMLSSFEVESKPYEVCFYFLGDHLRQVTLHSLSSPSDSQYQGIVTVLRAKYGHEVSQERSSIGINADWSLSSGVNISVAYIDKLVPLLNINYQLRMKAETDKL